MARTLPDLQYAVRTHGHRSDDFEPASGLCRIPILHEHCPVRDWSPRSTRNLATGWRRVSLYGHHRARIFRTAHDTGARAAPECGHRPPRGARRAAAQSPRTAIRFILKFWRSARSILFSVRSKAGDPAAAMTISKGGAATSSRYRSLTLAAFRRTPDCRALTTAGMRPVQTSPGATAWMRRRPNEQPEGSLRE